MATQPNIAVPAHQIVAGSYWSRDLVYWGEPGRKGKGEMLGIFTGQANKGRPTEQERERRGVNVWDLTVVYALFDRRSLEYVGEGKLGTRLRAHLKDPLKTWTHFSWFAPAQYAIGTAPAMASVTASADVAQLPSKEFVQLAELLLIYGGLPRANSQVPEKKTVILWLDQYEARKALGTLDDRLARIEKAVTSSTSPPKPN